MPIPVAIEDGETVDPILEGRIGVIQKKRGYRFAVDALLLSHFISIRDGERLLDLGTGSGIVALISAKRYGCSRFVGLDIQHDLVDMASRSAILNGIADRVEFRQGDIRLIETLFEAGSFDAVSFNPPYRRINSGRMNPDSQKAIARHEVKATIDDFLRAAGHCLRLKGRVFLIYPAVRLTQLLNRMHAGRLEPKRLTPVYSNAASAGQFVLVEGIKGAREALNVLPPVFIYDGDGRYTSTMQSIFSEIASFPACADG